MSVVEDISEVKYSPRVFRLLTQPRRFVGDFLIDRRFLLALTLDFFGLLFGLLVTKNFHYERHLFGAALIRCGWLRGYRWLLAGARLRI
jgi:hypothetical protein